MALCLYELARNQSLQEKLQQEIDTVFGKNELKDINYDLMTELKLLECCIDETLRK